MLLQLADGGILDISSDTEFYDGDGCETCDYGSEYINEFEITMTTGKIKIEVSQMHEFALSEGQMMKIILPNVETIKQMNEDEFYNWLKTKLNEMNDGFSLNVEFIKSTDMFEEE